MRHCLGGRKIKNAVKGSNIGAGHRKKALDIFLQILS